MRRTRPAVRLFQRSGEVRPTSPLALGVSLTWAFVAVGPYGGRGGLWVLWRVVIWARSWSFRCFNSSHLLAVLSQSITAFSCSRSNRACCFAIFSCISANILSWPSYVSGRWVSPAAPCEVRRHSSITGLRLSPLGETIPQRWQWICPWRWSCCQWSVAFSGPCLFGEFLMKSLVGEKSEYWDSDLNESTNLLWRFSATSDQTVDLHLSQD